jgi:hypothetical protein
MTLPTVSVPVASVCVCVGADGASAVGLPRREVLEPVLPDSRTDSPPGPTDRNRVGRGSRTPTISVSAVYVCVCVCATSTSLTATDAVTVTCRSGSEQTNDRTRWRPIVRSVAVTRRGDRRTRATDVGPRKRSVRRRRPPGYRPRAGSATYPTYRCTPGPSTRRPRRSVA